jgi:galactose dehydrogenase
MAEIPIARVKEIDYSLENQPLILVRGLHAETCAGSASPFRREPGARSMTVLVTGAAGGIGAATVRAFLDAGHDVIGIDRRPAALPGYAHLEIDLLDEPALRAALAEVDALQHVVCVAGGALMPEKTTHDVAELELDVWRASLDQNLTATFLSLQAALPALRRGEGNRSISLVSSTDALLSCGLPAYAAAKAGLIGLVHSLTGPLGAEGIRINAVAPGDIPTERNVAEWGHVDGWYARMREATALDRLVTVEEVASTFLAVATRLTSLTGQTLVVDGGLTLSHAAAWARAGDGDGAAR